MARREAIGFDGTLAVIIKGKSSAGPGCLAAHLLRTDQNERVDVREPRGSAAPE